MISTDTNYGALGGDFPKVSDYISYAILSLIIVSSYKFKNKQVFNNNGTITYWVEYSLLLLMKSCLLPRMSFTLYFLIKMSRSLLLYWSCKIIEQLELVKIKKRKIQLKCGRSKSEPVNYWKPKPYRIHIQDPSMIFFLRQDSSMIFFLRHDLLCIFIISIVCLFINTITGSDVTGYILDVIVFVLWVSNSHFWVSGEENIPQPTIKNNIKSDSTQFSKPKGFTYSEILLGIPIKDLTTLLLISLAYASLVSIYYCVSPFSCICQVWLISFVYLLFQ